MKKYLLLQLLILSVVPLGLKAQERAEVKPKKEWVIKANNLHQFSKKPLNNYYSLGSEIGMYFNDKWYVGVGQYSSLAPADIWKNNPYNPDKIQVYEYSLQAGYKLTLASPLYLYAGIRSGYRAMLMEYRYNNGVDTDETMTKGKTGGFFVTPDVQSGVKVHKYISIEAGINYRYNVGSKSRWGLSTDQLNGLGGQVSIVGHFPL